MRPNPKHGRGLPFGGGDGIFFFLGRTGPFIYTFGRPDQFKCKKSVPAGLRNIFFFAAPQSQWGKPPSTTTTTTRAGPPSGGGGGPWSGRVKRTKWIGAEAEQGSLDRPGRREHREPTVRPKIAAVGMLELKYRKRAQTLCGAGRRFGARRAASSNTTARTHPSDPTLCGAHGGHH